MRHTATTANRPPTQPPKFMNETDENPPMARPAIQKDTPKLGDINWYSVRTHCTNCNDHDYAYVKKGVRKAGLTIKCDKCGCTIEL